MKHLVTTQAEQLVLEAAADLAIDTGAVVCLVAMELMLVDDLTLIAGLANGAEMPSTTVLRRFDGRSVSLFELPDEMRLP